MDDNEALADKPAPRTYARRAVRPAPPPSRDIGTWKFTPWKGVDMWTHQVSGRTTFDEKEARKLRRL